VSNARFHCISLADVDAALIQRWRQLHAMQQFRSPFAHPAFALAVARARPEDSFVSVIESGGEIVGFLPHHKSEQAFCTPIGEMVNDWQSPVMAPGHAWDARAWIRALQFKRFTFDHVDATATRFRPVAMKSNRAHVMTVAGGYEAYCARVQSGRDSLPKLLKQGPRLNRKLARDCGPVTFELRCGAAVDLVALCRLKSQQYERTGVRDIMEIAWVRDLLTQLSTLDDGDFSGRLSVLRSGDRIVALHFGIVTEQVWHYWLPV
jgi:CelD/BcsL family acetyltransferase involved in cellulose biosynthesis